MTVILESNPIRNKLNLRTGWAQYREPSATDLRGRTIELEVPDDDTRVTLAFHDDVVSWTVTGDRAGSGEGEYGLTELRPGILFIDIADLPQERSVTVVLEEATGSAMIVMNQLTSLWGTLNMIQVTQPARVAGSDAPLFEQSNDLIGRRAIVYYEDGHAIEHVYMNQSLLGYQLLSGLNGAGHGNSLRATTWKIGHELYLLTFVEARPESVVLLMDFEGGRNTGKLFVRDDYGLVNMPAGARIAAYGPTVEYPEEFLNDPHLFEGDASVWTPGPGSGAES